MGSTKAIKEVERTLDALCQEARPIMLEAMRPDSCIAATCIGQAVLHGLGVQARPLAVKMAAFNAKAHAYMMEGHADWVRQQRDGAYSVGAGYGHGPDPHGWDGHLVLVAAGNYLVDLSVDQVCRPKHDLTARAFFAPLPNHWDTNGGMVLQSRQGTVLVYEDDHDNVAWRAAPDWSVVRWADVIVKVRQAVARHLGGKA